MEIWLGLSAALGWGVADFCARFASRHAGFYRTLFYMQFFGAIGLSLYLLFFELQQAGQWQSETLALAALLAVGNTSAGLALYYAFEVGLLSLASPIAASYGAITLFLSILSGERPSVPQLIGLGLTVVGVVLASVQLSSQKKEGDQSPTKGIGWAIFASLCFGVVFWGLRFVTPNLGGVVPVWESRLIAPVLLLLLARPAHQTLQIPPKPSWKWIVAVGIIDSLAFLSYTQGIHLAGATGLVAVLSSLFSLVTIILARIFLKERLASWQWFGIGLVLVGIGLVAYG